MEEKDLLEEVETAESTDNESVHKLMDINKDEKEVHSKKGSLYEASIQDERAAYISIVSAVGSTYYNIIMLDELIESQKHIVILRSW